MKPKSGTHTIGNQAHTKGSIGTDTWVLRLMVVVLAAFTIQAAEVVPYPLLPWDPIHETITVEANGEQIPVGNVTTPPKGDTYCALAASEPVTIIVRNDRKRSDFKIQCTDWALEPQIIEDGLAIRMTVRPGTNMWIDALKLYLSVNDMSSAPPLLSDASVVDITTRGISATSTQSQTAQLQSAIDAVKNARKEGYALLYNSHRAWWHNFWEKGHFLSIPDTKLESAYCIQVYKVASATRPDKPQRDNRATPGHCLAQ